MDELRIRKAEETDLQEIIRIWKRNIRTINTASDIANLFHYFKKYFFLAVLDPNKIMNRGKLF